jgi:phosphate:Na+ symporter
MASLEPAGPQRRTRLVAAWVLTGAVLGTYFFLPDGDNADSTDAQKTADATEPERLEVIGVAPADPSPGTAVSVRYLGKSAEAEIKVYLGKRELRVLARRPSSLVAQLPGDLTPGHLKLRIAAADERSKPYDLRIKATNWRKPFRNLMGGFALLVLGISVLARGARGITGLQSATTFARVARRRLAAVSFGSVVGALMQSTTAAAGLLAGLVDSGVLAVTPAASAFLGAQLGAAATPLLVAGIIEPRDGLLVIAIGVLWFGLAPDRRSAALGRFVLGAGLVAFGLQVLRPGLEPFVSNPVLLSLAERWSAPGPLRTAGTALLGAGLAAALQGPAPVLVLALGIAEATGHWDVRSMLALLSGTGLGAALGALLTTPAGPSCRRLAQLNLAAAACGTLFAASTIDIWSAIADQLVAGHVHEVRFGKRVLLPGVSWHLTVAFALSQLAVTLVSLSLLPFLHRWLERLRPESRGLGRAMPGDASAVVAGGLVRVLQVQRRALDPIPELTLHGSREAGRSAEHQLSDAHRVLQTLLSDAVPTLAKSERSSDLSRVAFACLQLQRSLEGVLRQAEQLTDARIAAGLGRGDPAPLDVDDRGVLGEIHALLADGIDTLRADLEKRVHPDMEEACSREIRINGIESRARNALLMGMREPHEVRNHVAVLELVDAYEAAGNQVFRVAEALGGAQLYTDAPLAESA